MKKILKSAFITCSIVFAMSALTSCEGEDGLAPTGNEEHATTIPTAAGEYQVNENITAEANSTVDYNVTFNSETKMYRLYVSQNVYGSADGTVAYDIEKQAVNVDTKSDGSVDLKSGDKKSFTKTIPLLAPAKNGVTVYKIWVTGGGAFSSSKGDFRDTAKNNAFDPKNGVVTVTITAGTPNVTAKGMKEFTKTILAAPLANGVSKTFMSVYNGQIYDIAGAKESAALWDFGYFYGSTVKASIRSLKEYPTAAYDVAAKSGIALANLNDFFVKKSTFNVAKFDSATVTELNALGTPSTNKVDGLSVGNVLEFQDAYGTKGLIKVLKIEGTNGTSGKITFAVKVQDLSVQL